jgi:hypothetical protein
MNVVETIVSEAVLEAAVSYGDAVSQEMALFELDQGTGFSYVLGDSRDMLEVLEMVKARAQTEHELPINNAATQVMVKDRYLTNMAIVGVIDVEEKTKDLYYVAASAAMKGFGPLMYDLGMKLLYPSWLTADRTGRVSKAAAGIWKFYDLKRPDVEKKDLVAKQQATFKKLATDDTGSLNKAFRQKGEFMKLFNNRNKLIKTYEAAGVSKDTLQYCISKGSEQFFTNLYDV